MRRWRVGLPALLAALALPGAAARAATVTSTNWSGYAAHRSGVHFKTVSGSWRQPTGSCSTSQSASAFWVGIGGYSKTAPAMEQIGTELDCDSDGTASISAWYELVPSASHTINLAIHGGDLVSAKVVVVGKQVTLTFKDLTRHETFSKTITASAIDTTSAEWIAEAPSDCASPDACTTLALADFGSVRFVSASAQTAGGRTAGISSGLWTTTKILLGYSGSSTTQFVAASSKASAAPGALASAGRAFTVTYAAPTTSSSTTTSSDDSSSSSSSSSTDDTSSSSSEDGSQSGAGGFGGGGGPGGGGPGGGGPGGGGGGPGGG